MYLQCHRIVPIVLGLWFLCNPKKTQKLQIQRNVAKPLKKNHLLLCLRSNRQQSRHHFKPFNVLKKQVEEGRGRNRQRRGGEGRGRNRQRRGGEGRGRSKQRRGGPAGCRRRLYKQILYILCQKIETCISYFIVATSARDSFPIPLPYPYMRHTCNHDVALICVAATLCIHYNYYMHGIKGCGLSHSIAFKVCILANAQTTLQRKKLHANHNVHQHCWTSYS